MNHSNTAKNSPLAPPPFLMDLLPSTEFHLKYDLQLTGGDSGNRAVGVEEEKDAIPSSTTATLVSGGETTTEKQQKDKELQCTTTNTTTHMDEDISSSEKKGRESVVVGKGSFGSVLLCTSRSSGVKCAVKIINNETPQNSRNGSSSERSSSDKDVQRQNQQQHAANLSGRTELKVLQLLQQNAARRKKNHHPNLMHLKDCFPLETFTACQSSSTIPSSSTSSSYQQQHPSALVLPLIDGGDLFDEVNSGGAYPEQEAKALLFGLLEGLVHLHEDLGIAHRDIKPENILLHKSLSRSGAAQSNEEQLQHPSLRFSRPTHGVLADFGLAGKVPSYECCGSPLYAAPELLLARRRGVSYTTKVDLYSLGIVAYALLTGNVPFAGTNEEIMKHTIHSTISFRARNGWNKVSVTAKQFVQKLLDKDPRDRLSARQALEHPWFRLMEQLGSAQQPLNHHISPNDPLVGIEPIEVQQTEEKGGKEEGDAVPPPSQQQREEEEVLSPRLISPMLVEPAIPPPPPATTEMTAHQQYHVKSSETQEKETKDNGGLRNQTLPQQDPIVVETAPPPKVVLPAVKQHHTTHPQKGDSGGGIPPVFSSPPSSTPINTKLLGRQITVMSTESNLGRLSSLLQDSVTSTSGGVGAGSSNSSANPKDLGFSAISTATIGSTGRLPSALLEGLPFTKTSSSDECPPGVMPGSLDG